MLLCAGGWWLDVKVGGGGVVGVGGAYLHAVAVAVEPFRLQLL